MGIVTVVNPEPKNTPVPMLVTELGIVIDIKLVQPLNALLPIVPIVEVGVNVTVPKFVQV